MHRDQADAGHTDARGRRVRPRAVEHRRAGLRHGGLRHAGLRHPGFRLALPAAVAMALLTACGGGAPSAAGTASPSGSTASGASDKPGTSLTPSAAASSAPPTTSPLTQDTRAAFRAAMAAHPGADLDTCTQETPLDDRACGAAITAADRVAADTARRLRRKHPEHATTLYGPTLAAAAGFRNWLGKLRDPIPCYGLSDAQQPPPPLMSDAQSICADGVAIAKTHWGLFLSAAGVSAEATEAPSGG